MTDIIINKIIYEIKNNIIEELQINNIKDLNILYNYIINNKSIKRLILNLGNKNKKEEINKVYDIIKYKNTIEFLQFIDTNITNIDEFINIMKNNKTIKTLDFLRSVNNEELNKISEIFKYNNTIEYIDLNWNNITNIKILIENIKINNSIKILDLTDNCITDINYLFDYLKNNKCKIKELYLTLNQKECDELSEVIKYNKSLSLLYLFGDINKIENLCKGLNINKTITEFGIMPSNEIVDMYILFEILNENECKIDMLKINPIEYKDCFLRKMLNI